MPSAIFPGAAFIFLANAGGWQRWFFIVLSTGVSGLIVVWIWRIRKQGQVLLSISLAMVLGGAVGNLIDRVRLGHVTDFIQVWFGSWAFPSFNVADAGISVGAALLIIDALFFSGRQTTPAEAAAATETNDLDARVDETTSDVVAFRREMRFSTVLFVVLFALATAASAELVLFKTGYSLEVDAFRIEGSKFIMEVGGGTLTVPTDLVVNIEDNELVTALPGARRKSRPPTRLDFKGSSRAPNTPYGTEIHAVARRFRFNSRLLAALVAVESGFEKDKVSPLGRRGLLQVDPEHSFGIDPQRLFEPEANLESGVRKLNWLRKRYSNDFERVLTAYHFGRELVDRAGGVPADPDIEDYLEKVQQALQDQR